MSHSKAQSARHCEAWQPLSCALKPLQLPSLGMLNSFPPQYDLLREKSPLYTHHVHKPLLLWKFTIFHRLAKMSTNPASAPRLPGTSLPSKGYPMSPMLELQHLGRLPEP